MSTAQIQQHFQRAFELEEQRQQLLEQDWLYQDSLALLEHRLIHHRYALQAEPELLAQLQPKTPNTTSNALITNLWRAEISLSTFSPFYLDSNITIAANALQAGWLRNDPKVQELVATRIHNISDHDTSALPLLKLAALISTENLLAPLLNFANTHPQLGLPLLGLAGRIQAMPIILNALKSAATLDAANQVWQLLTGESLRLKPRLQVIAATGMTTSSTQTIHDAEYAQQWWKENQNNFSPDKRYFFGREVTVKNLLHWYHVHAGQRCGDVNLLLAQLSQKLHYIDLQQYRTIQLAELEKYYGDSTC